MTTTSPSPEAEALPTLPVVAWRDQAFEDFAADFGAEFAIRSCGTTYADAQTHAMWCCWRETHAPAGAAIVALRDDRDSWCQQASARTEDAVRFAAERDALRAEVAELRKERDAAMVDAGRYRFLRDPLTYEKYPELDRMDYTSSEELDVEIDKRIAIDAARASLLGDGGTL